MEGAPGADAAIKKIQKISQNSEGSCQDPLIQSRNLLDNHPRIMHRHYWSTKGVKVRNRNSFQRFLTCGELT